MCGKPGYHPLLLAVFGDGATDMIPMDLVWERIDKRFCFLFNWREYFCTLFYELKAVYLDNYCFSVRSISPLPINLTEIWNNSVRPASSVRGNWITRLLTAH
ncbi:hypothetical protein ASPWEDRAFT_46695 [Aspergillus wentii DTO 134E9]|uniref:Uncharacterized protein n=1 Tax=Aspergillus wentii DTO 134E9 TaxID=1073089 RepID=A0A1L9R4X2_ASPWE|nr:uncharacterized protein ASPWEDRAFT_46695 [Aspergillus wentii DTO 134E9]OJJ29966.1 hypothetical protein ASPWEDRAFT_46695 [Aspergillus wentii DTO 134E9]